MAKPKAFTGYKSKLYVDGILLSQVVRVDIGERVEVLANFQPHCPAHQKVLEALQSHGAFHVKLELPPDADAAYEWDSFELSGGVSVRVDEVCALRFSFAAAYSKLSRTIVVTNADSGCDSEGRVYEEIISAAP